MLPAGQRLDLLLLLLRRILLDGPCSSKLSGRFGRDVEPSPMPGHLKRSTLGSGSEGRTRDAPKNRQRARLPSVLTLLSLLAFLFTPPAALGQDPEEMKGAT